MKIKSFIILTLLVNNANAQSYQDIHKKAILVDTHNDFLTKVMQYDFALDSDLKGKTHTDLSRLKTGGVDVQFFSVWSDGNQRNPFAFANRQIDSLDAAIKRNPDKIVKVANVKELLKVVKQNKIAALIGLEGGHQIENSLENIDIFYSRGTRYITLTWNNSTDWATSAFDEKTKPEFKGKGLSDFGKKVVQHMNKIGMMVDISHVSEKTFWDVMETTSKPIIASHSSVYQLCPVQRNLKDDQIKAIAKNNGVIQINFNSGFIDPTVKKREDDFMESHKAELDSLTAATKNENIAEEMIHIKYKQDSDKLRAPFSLVMDHIEYIIKLVGIDYVGIGSDFDGIVLPPQQLDDVTTYPLITKALIERGYSKKDINKILGGNILRVLKANEVH
ncbi:dipeptidase [Flavobacterium aquidurense]|uniref:dipeptidase n=1 Tax=Flavobacterium aquidurense TaxID=362413 RepID=UPI0028566B7E|nr:dipeptidase [Flavobacterium aquidurense]MDR7371773.1 membrane dipeptidase [Flavobacterium aquidurense]